MTLLKKKTSNEKPMESKDRQELFSKNKKDRHKKIGKHVLLNPIYQNFNIIFHSTEV